MNKLFLFIHAFRVFYYRLVGNRRRYLRKYVRVKVTEKTTGVFEHFASTNISAGGMFMKSERPFALGSKIKVEFSLPGSDKVYQTAARVVRTVAPGNASGHCPGMGVQFTGISEEDRKSIDEFVKSPGVS